MMRRFAGILTSLMVLTFSFSGWSNVCPTMSLTGTSQALVQDMPGMTHHDHGSPSPSHHNPGDRTGTDHCQHVTSCNSSTFAPVADREIPLVLPTGVVFPPSESPPSSQSPELEPPPPKA